MAVQAERRLAAIMFTDIVGYTRSTQANESLTLELLEEHRNVVRPLFSPRGGTEVKTIGDAFLVEFKSAQEAVLCAVDIQKKLKERNSGVPGARKVELRIGIHLGDVVHGSGDVYGDAVNIASRIEPLAEPGGICISQQVYDNIRNKTELTIQPMGQVELKNVELPLGVYKIVMQASGTGMNESQAPRERLAVLPFVNISPDPNDEYFADGLTEELITKLSEIGNLRVIARTSVMNYKRKEKKISEIGRELGVGSIIEGSVRKAGNKIRVTVQLIDARNEEHLWASTYDKELDDIFAIQSDVASKVAGSISSNVFPPVKRKDTDDVEAYTLYIRAMHLYHDSTEASLKEAIALFDKAIARDPNFVRAYAGLSYAWGRMTGYEEFTIATANAEAAAKKALELGPDWAESHSAMAAVHSFLDRYEESVSEAEKAISLNPNLSEVYVSLGIQSSTLGRLEEGLSAFEKAYELDPLSITARFFAALVSNITGKGNQALTTLERIRQLNPGNPRVYTALAECYMLEGDFIKAQEMVDAGRQVSPNEPMVIIDQGSLYASTGRRKEAEDILKVIEGNQKESVRLYGQLIVNAALGNLDEAFKALMREAELHSWPFLVRSLPVFKEMRKDPRFKEFCRKVGLPA